MKNMREKQIANKCSMVALDSNIVIFLARTKNGSINHKNGRLPFFDSLRILKQMNEKGHLKFVITPTVLCEICKKLDRREREFLKAHCVVAIPKNEGLFARQVYELAKKYQENNVMQNDGKYVNSDSMIMAEASILGLNLITANERDFIAYGHDEQSFNKNKKGRRKRADDIKKINAREGYGVELSNGLSICPTAFSVQSFLDLYRTEIFPVKYKNEYNYSSQMFK